MYIYMLIINDVSKAVKTENTGQFVQYSDSWQEWSNTCAIYLTK